MATQPHRPVSGPPSGRSFSEAVRQDVACGSGRTNPEISAQRAAPRVSQDAASSPDRPHSLPAFCRSSHFASTIPLSDENLFVVQLRFYSLSPWQKVCSREPKLPQRNAQAALRQWIPCSFEGQAGVRKGTECDHGKHGRASKESRIPAFFPFVNRGCARKCNTQRSLPAAELSAFAPVTHVTEARNR